MHWMEVCIFPVYCLQTFDSNIRNSYVGTRPAYFCNGLWCGLWAAVTAAFLTTRLACALDCCSGSVLRFKTIPIIHPYDDCLLHSGKCLLPSPLFFQHMFGELWLGLIIAILDPMYWFMYSLALTYQRGFGLLRWRIWSLCCLWSLNRVYFRTPSTLYQCAKNFLVCKVHHPGRAMKIVLLKCCFSFRFTKCPSLPAADSRKPVYFG